MENGKKIYNKSNLEIKEFHETNKNKELLEECIKKRRPSRTKKRIFRSYGFYITILLIIINVTGTLVMWCTNVIDDAIIQYLSIKDDGYFYKLWRNPQLDIQVKVYPFNYTNIEAVMLGKEKLRVEEIGPYVFSENSNKVNIKFNGTDFISYSYNRTFTYMRKYSKGSLRDNVITPNVVYIAANDRVANDPMQQMGLNLILAGLNSKPFVAISLHEFILGYDDNFSWMLRKINKLLRKEVNPPFGILSKRVGLSSDLITIGTGVNDVSSFGIIKKFNDIEELGAWNSSSCNSISASDGNLFPSSAVLHDDYVYLYAKDLCRRIPLKFEKEFINDEGYPVRRFVIPRNVFATPDVNPENSCFCKETCAPSGVQDISPCYFDAPFIMSQPHFMYADKEVFENIDGLHPEPEKHTYYSDLHKYLGFPLKSKTRLQIGIMVNNKTTLARRYKSLKNGVILPIAWMEFGFDELPENINNLLYHATFTAARAKIILRWSFLTISLIATIRFIMYVIFHKYY